MEKRQEMNGTLLSIRNLQAWYTPERPVLSGLSLDLQKHEIVGLIGLNGAGKTTFLNILSGLHSSFQADTVQLHGRSIKFRDRRFKQNRYTVFSEDHSFQYFTFREYLNYVFKAYQKKIPDVSALIQGFHFEAFTDILMKDLSTGNRKKVFLITAFALGPELLLLDEPVNGLDFESTEYLYRLIAEYKTCGTVLFSSHILESITLTSDRILVLENGQMQKSLVLGETDAGKIREVLHAASDV